MSDGLCRGYSKESPSSKPGLTRGRKIVKEYDPNLDEYTVWAECYDHDGNINRIRLKSINGTVVNEPHFPPTGKDLMEFEEYFKDL